ncbi:MAG TPA: hypothetical protein VFU94_07925 [Conexibacter sp.]|nr:hypothetical protein [Conexibacter sp.]
MPVEGQWERSQTPLRRLTRRELRLLQGFLAVLLLAVAASVVLMLTTSAPPVPRDCIQVTGGSAVGAANFRACGAGRAAWCREVAGRDDPTSLAVQKRCVAEGLSPRSARP